MMENQVSIDFDAIHGMYRNTDPETSELAGMSIDARHLIGSIYTIMARYPEGCIADDVENHLPNTRSHSITPRFKQMVEMGMIEKTGEKRLASSGHWQEVRKVLPPPFIPMDKKETYKNTIIALRKEISVKNERIAALEEELRNNKQHS